MIITTTQSIEGQTIREYKGIVVGDAIMGANIVRALSSSELDQLADYARDELRNHLRAFEG